MKYGIIDLLPVKGSITIAKEKNMLVRHYPGTDRTNHAHLGKKATRITCTLIAQGDAERILIEQILHDDAESTLTLHNFYYKKVITGETHQPVPETPDKDVWLIGAEFIALDPIPYDVDTDGALY